MIKETEQIQEEGRGGYVEKEEGEEEKKRKREKEKERRKVRNKGRKKEKREMMGEISQRKKFNERLF